MKAAYLDELKSACQKVNLISEVEKNETGETVWFAGKPAQSSNGTIALKIGLNQTIVINEKDILNVEKDENLFFVEISSGNNYLYKFEIVGKASVKSGCKCNKDRLDPNTEQVSRNTSINVNDRCARICRVEPNCIYVVDSKGYVRLVCFPYPVCESPCIFA